LQKSRGKQIVNFFSGEMTHNAVASNWHIENSIRHGLKEDLFTVFFKPKVDIASGKARQYGSPSQDMNTPWIKGLVQPSQFIS